MTQKQAIDKVLSKARAEIGYREEANNWNKYAEYLNGYPDLFWGGSKQFKAWCCTFIVWIFVSLFGVELAIKMLCAPEKPNGLAGCEWAAKYYRNAGRWFTTPQAGDQIFFGSVEHETHTGIVESVDGGIVTTIEGNTSDGVYRRQYSLSDHTIAGYGRPQWDAVAEEAEPEPEPEPEPAKPTTMFVLALPVIKNGDKGSYVKAVQSLLIADGHYCGGKIVNKKEIPDGDFGPSTENAVKIFQMTKRLTKDGIVGLETMKALLGVSDTDG